MAKKAAPVVPPITDPKVPVTTPPQGAPDSGPDQTTPKTSVDTSQPGASSTSEEQTTGLIQAGADDPNAESKRNKYSYTVVSALRHNGIDYAEGDDIDLECSEGDPLVAAGILNDE